MAPTRIETPAHQPGDRFSIMPIANRKKKMCRKLKVVMLGNGGVGKARVLSALTNNGGVSVGLDFRTMMASVDSEIVKLQLWHGANQEKFGAGLLPRSYFRNARGAFLVFNTANRASFLAATEWARQLQQTHDKHQPLAVVLVAVDQHHQLKTPTQVSVSEARSMASILQAKLVEFTDSEDDGERCLQAMVDALTVPTPWCVDLSDAPSRLQTIQASIQEEVSAESETESESEPENIDDEVDQEPRKSLVSAPPITVAGTWTQFAILAPGRRASGLFMTLELGHTTLSVGVFCSVKRSALLGMCLLLRLSPVMLMIWLLLVAHTNSSTTTGGFLMIVELVQDAVLESAPTLAHP